MNPEEREGRGGVGRGVGLGKICRKRKEDEEGMVMSYPYFGGFHLYIEIGNRILRSALFGKTGWDWVGRDHLTAIDDGRRTGRRSRARYCSDGMNDIPNT